MIRPFYRLLLILIVQTVCMVGLAVLVHFIRGPLENIGSSDIILTALLFASSLTLSIKVLYRKLELNKVNDFPVKMCIVYLGYGLSSLFVVRQLERNLLDIILFPTLTYLISLYIDNNEKQMIPVGRHRDLVKPLYH
jgi:hypothetical protein